MSIKCHSSFVHYNMFHDKHNHCGGNNFGSIFNITNNCNGGHTGFWGGFGAGLGYGLGNLFSGFMGGMGNMFSGFGMNMFGGFGNMFGGFGMNMFSGIGNMFGDWNTNSCNCCNKNSRYKGKKDYDYNNDDKKTVKEIKTETPEKKDKAEKTTKTTTQEKTKINGKPIDELTLEDIAGIKEKDYKKLSNEEKEELRTQLANLITEDNDEIQKMLSNKKFPNELSRIIHFKLSNLETAKPVEETPIEETPVEPAPVEETPVVITPKNTIKIGNNDKNISDLTADDITNITNENYNTLEDTAKNALKDKVYSLAKGDKNKATKWASSTTLPSDLRAEAKRSFYHDGYANVTLASLTNEEIKKLKTVIDTSEIKDFKNIKSITEITRKDNGELESFKMTAQSGTSVTYVTVSVVDGELIFHGDKDDQEYVLQKDSKGDYHLMQYEYHKGNGTPDVIDN